ncbi:NmrA family NAD(P)-binding protein [Actinoallomurus soli]|uniref:NmrA family NAD(P)-binding protein n=1 Tax=Actinoallomurus soli TaxID=2952535 RepID=UPI0020934043|nr:NmrA family NAD(P)-binding protein [Actinoallomurus soli]MCO5973616.1 NAD(P)H-binding protein [Actinoallomurus soli]
MIVVTGATGALNGATADHLLQRVSAGDLAVVTRDVAKAARFADLGVEVRQGDYARPDTLPDAFRGADKLLLVSSNDPNADAVGLHRAAIEAAVEVGVGRIFYTSHQGAAADSPMVTSRGHAATEQILAESGVAWTALRNGFYAHSLTWLAGPWRETGVITVPADGPVSWTAREDAAEAAAIILTSDRTFDGPTVLTAGAAPTFQDIAAIASDLSGRKIDYDLVAPEEWIAAQVQQGNTEFMARLLLSMYQAAEKGYFSAVDPLLGELLAREPRSARDALAQPAA